MATRKIRWKINKIPFHTDPNDAKQSSQTSTSVLKRKKSVKIKPKEPLADHTNAEQTLIPNDLSVNNQFLSETNHFDITSTAQSKTSNNRLEQSHRINYNEMFDILKNYKYKYNDQVERLSLNYEYSFEKWIKQLK